jgi:hypothetical protein
VRTVSERWRNRTDLIVPLAELEEGEFQVERSKEPGREITF